MCSLYDKLVLPVVHYNCEIWGFHAAREVERTHLLFCKKILKMNSRTADYFIYGELGRYALKLNRHYCRPSSEDRSPKYRKIRYGPLKK